MLLMLGTNDDMELTPVNESTQVDSWAGCSKY